MQADDASQQKFKDVATRGFGDRMALTERGLVAGGVLLAKMGDEGLCINGEKERILTLLSIAHRCAVPPAVFGFLRRASKHWRSGDKTLACMQLSQSGLGKLDEEGAYRLSLAAELIEAGFTPRELARELGLSPVQFDISKYDENQPRVPAGNGRESGRWTSADGTPAVAPESTLTEGRSAGRMRAIFIVNTGFPGMRSLLPGRTAQRSTIQSLPRKSLGGQKEAGMMPTKAIRKPNEKAFQMDHRCRSRIYSVHCGTNNCTACCLADDSLELRRRNGSRLDRRQCTRRRGRGIFQGLHRRRNRR